MEVRVRTGHMFTPLNSSVCVLNVNCGQKVCEWMLDAISNCEIMGGRTLKRYILMGLLCVVTIALIYQFSSPTCFSSHSPQNQWISPEVCIHFLLICILIYILIVCLIFKWILLYQSFNVKNFNIFIFLNEIHVCFLMP